MILTAQIIGTLAMIFNIASFQCKKNRHLVFMLGLGSLLFCISFTIGGIICEIFTIVSVIVSFIRYRKNEFEI